MSCKDDMSYIKEEMLFMLKEHCRNPQANATELGMVSDIVKDMCEAEYYCTVIEAMNKPVIPPLAGYGPIVDKQPYIHDYLDMTVGERMGYNPTSTVMHPTDTAQYGRAYREYERARKHFTATKDENDKKEAMKEMKKHMDEHTRDVITTFRQMWSDADPEQRMRLKHDIQTLLEDMKE